MTPAGLAGCRLRPPHTAAAFMAPSVAAAGERCHQRLPRMTGVPA
eukprot:CAMPEP_0170416800 /NCGR_PEP_ID=MMETSP0117_2-20130122/33358_1 /TAXON_ID=400756 /ORGANISM="Durinskia baltica, Strain CSIRO CS-38" /LENGTH=44 /DNA_ID= /DNA_START= /DNA_END= /DNA_ORIENTATION=